MRLYLTYRKTSKTPAPKELYFKKRKKKDFQRYFLDMPPKITCLATQTK